LVLEDNLWFCFGAPAPPPGQKRPGAREGPALAGREPGIRFRMGAGALHGSYITTPKWDCKYKNAHER